MASTIGRDTVVTDGAITVSITLVAKDAGDTSLIQKWGDIIIDPSQQISDPLDLTYPKFIIQAGDPVSFYTTGVIRAIISDSTLALADLQKRAKLWGDQIQLNIQNDMIALRALSDTSTGTSTIVI